MLKYSVNFYPGKPIANESVPVRMLVSFIGKRPEFYIGVEINPEEWDPKMQRIRNKKSLENKELDKVENIIEGIFEYFEINEKRFPTVQELRAKYKEATDLKPKEEKPSEEILIQDLFDMYSKKVGAKNEWTETTYRKYNKIKHHFYFYNPNLTLESLTEDDVIGFIKYCQSGPIDYHTLKKKNPHRNSTIAKNFTDFMSIISWASDEGLYSGKLHKTLKPKFKGSAGDLKDIIHLTWDELQELYHYEFSAEHLSLEKIRDVFCFCCFSGVRYSDVFKLRKSQIKDGYFTLATEKTIDPIKIELNDYSSSILEKYKDVEFPGNKALPVISMQKFNDGIKEVAKLLDFDEEINEVFFVGSKRFEVVHKKYDKISSHAGRRTFVVNGLTLGIPDKVIMKWTGHKSFSAMKPYVKIVDDLKKSEMNKFNKK